MVLCNAIVGNYDESNFKTIPERLLTERRMIISGSSDSNSIYILFRIIPSDNDLIPKENQGLMINYYSMNKSEENNKRSHYLVPIYNDYNVFCYWISSRYLRIKKKELCFTISDFIKEYWKQPIFTQEFTDDIFMSNKNVLSFESIPNNYPGYNRVINIEKEENVQMICINLKYRNKDFIIIENLIESAKALLAPSSVFNGNNTIKDFYISEERGLGQEQEKEQENNQEYNQNQDPEQEQENNQEQNQILDMEKVCENEETRNEFHLIPEISYEDPKVALNDYTTKEEEDILKNEINCKSTCISTHTNNNDSSQLFTVCTGTNVNIIHLKKPNYETSNSLVINKEEVVINQVSEYDKRKNTISKTNECQITNSPLTLDAVITPITTPVNRNFKNRVKNQNNESLQEIHSKTDLIQRNYSTMQSFDNFSSTSNFNTCKTRNQVNSFLPPGMQIDTGIGNINQMNREELILNRIESARKNVNLNHRIYTGGNFFGGYIHGNRTKISRDCGIYRGINNYSICTNNHTDGAIINNSGRIKGSYNASFDNNIDILSKKFNRAIGKADYLLEQLSNSRESNAKFQRIKNEADSYSENYSNKKISPKNPSSSVIDSFQNYHSFDLQKSTNSPILLDNTFNIRNELVERQAQSLYNSNKEKINQKNSKNFNYTRESNLSIVNNNNLEIKKVLVDVQINTQLDNSNDEIEQNIESLEISQTKLNHKENFNQVIDLEKVEEPLEKGLETTDFDEKLKESDSFEVEEVEIRRRSIIDPELVEVDFYVNGGKLKSSFSILNVLLSRWSGIPVVSKL